MSLVLAIEPDSSQADILRQLLRDRLVAKVELVASKEAALAALDRQVPDLILVTALLSPRDEDEIVTHLRSLDDAAHLQTLTIPQLRRADESVRRTSLFDKFQKKSPKPAASGCDPAVFAEEVSSYLARACEVRRQRQMAPHRVPVGAAPVVARVETAPDVEKALLSAEQDDSIDEIERLIRGLGVDPTSIQTVEVDGFSEADSPAIIEISLDDEISKRQSWRGRKLREVEPAQIGPVPEVEALEAEVARVRAEAEARLRAELDRVCKQAEDARIAEQFEAKARAEEIRQASAREAREIAEAAASRTLEMEIARVRAEAEVRLAADLAEVRAEAEQRRQAELEGIRRQVAEMREAAAEQARSAAAAIAAEVARSAFVSKQNVATSPKPPSVIRVQGSAIPQRSGPATGGRAPAATPAVDSPSPFVGFGPVAPGSPFQEPKVLRLAPEHQPEIQTRTDIAVSGDASPASETVGGPSDYYSLWRAETAKPAEAQPAQMYAPRSDRIRRARWALPVAASLLLAAGDTVSIDVTSWLGLPGEAAVENATARPEPAALAPPLRTVGTLQVESTPSGARIRLDGDVLGKSPLTLPEVAAGRHTLVIESSAGTVTRTITVRQGETTSVVEAIFPGWITVFSRIPVDLYANRRHLGSTDDGQIMIEPGRHEIQLVNQQFNFRKTETFEILPGKVTSYSVALPTGVVHINAVAGGEVWIEGEFVGYVPMRDVSVPIGTREILVRDPEFGERREFVDVRAGQDTEVTFKVTR